MPRKKAKAASNAGKVSTESGRTDPIWWLRAENAVWSAPTLLRRHYPDLHAAIAVHEWLGERETPGPADHLEELVSREQRMFEAAESAVGAEALPQRADTVAALWLVVSRAIPSWPTLELPRYYELVLVEDAAIEGCRLFGPGGPQYGRSQLPRGLYFTLHVLGPTSVRATAVVGSCNDFFATAGVDVDLKVLAPNRGALYTS